MVSHHLIQVMSMAPFFGVICPVLGPDACKVCLASCFGSFLSRIFFCENRYPEFVGLSSETKRNGEQNTDIGVPS